MNAAHNIALLTGVGKNMALCLPAKGIDVIITYNSQKEEARKNRRYHSHHRTKGFGIATRCRPYCFLRQLYCEDPDIGRVVAFQCSDESKWVNGQRIEVSGGIFF